MSIVTIQLTVIFVFGLVISGIVALGTLRAREAAARAAQVERHAEKSRRERMAASRS